MESVVYTVEEAAEILKVGRSKVFDLIRDDQIRSVKIGGSRRIPARSITEYVDRLLEASA